MKLFSRSYDDSALIQQAEAVLAEDPTLPPTVTLEVTSVNGVVTLTGQVHSEREKAHVAAQVQTAFARTGLKYQHLENQIQVH